jgi:NTP pyrophosphatase (non-canonical NTP hydrolase)
MSTIKVQTDEAIINGLNALLAKCFLASDTAGWWTNLETGDPLQRNKLEMLMLVTTEIAEAAEGVRKGIMDDHLPHRKMEEVEMADAVIRIADYCGGHGLDLAGAIIEKMEYNKHRADHKMANRLKDGGKKA